MLMFTSAAAYAQYTGTFEKTSFDLKDKPVCTYTIEQGGSMLKKETYVSLVEGSFIFHELSFEGKELQMVFRYTAKTIGIDVAKSGIDANQDAKRSPKDFYYLYFKMKEGYKVKLETFYLGSGAQQPTEAIDSYVAFTNKSIADKYLSAFGK